MNLEVDGPRFEFPLSVWPKLEPGFEHLYFQRSESDKQKKAHHLNNACVDQQGGSVARYLPANHRGSAESYSWQQNK